MVDPALDYELAFEGNNRGNNEDTDVQPYYSSIIFGQS